MKTNDILNEKPSVADVKKQQNRSMTQKADDFMRKSFLQKSIDTLQGATGRRGVAPTELEPKYKIVKKKKEKGAVKGEPQAQAPAQAPKPSSGFPVSKTGVELKPGDNITYQNAKGQMKDGVVTVMLKTRDRQGDLQIQLKKGPAVFAVDRQNIRTANGEPWEYDPKTPDTGKVKESILKEGGNVFKSEEGPLTQRIATKDVRPTVDFIEKITGLEFIDDDLLGTTGKKTDPDGTFEKNSSGDLDLNTDANKISKEQLIAKLKAYLAKQGVPEEEMMNQGRNKTDGYIHNAGDQVHFRTPIQGTKGYVQTDFMFTNDPDFQRGAKRGGTAQYGGKDRAVLLSSIARGRGLKFSPKFGVVDPNNGDKVVANKWEDIAKVLLGPTATEADTLTVESMLAKIKGLPEYEDLIAGFKDSMEKAGKPMPESNVETLGDKHLRRLKELL
tara:strand:- start:10516 stop:11844 length:1329 start_codon:yes stop_codon:yes gene_type:complete